MGRTNRGIFAGLRDRLGLAGAPGTVEDRVRQISLTATERPIPDGCPQCEGALVLIDTNARRVHADLTTMRTFCPNCGIEEEWHQRL